MTSPDICLFTKTEYVPETIPPKAGYPRCYEQTRKLRFKWFASFSERDADGFLQYREVGPFENYAAACRYAGR